MPICSKCKELVDDSQYNKNRQCKKCCKEYNKAYNDAHKKEKSEYDALWYATHKDRKQEKNRKYWPSWYAAHKIEASFQNARYRAETNYNQKYLQTENGKFHSRKASAKYRSLKKNLINDLTLDQWQQIIQEQKNRCALCERDFATHGLNVHCDHIIPVNKSKEGDPGLTKSNVQALCSSCNTAKRDRVFTKEEYEKFKQERIKHFQQAQPQS